MNDLTKRLGIQLPFIQGGMGNISEPILAAAVSNAGGLGTIGAGTRSAAEVKTLIRELKTRTDKPFALNIPISVNEEARALAQLAVEEHVPVVSLSAGNPAPFLQKLKEHKKAVIVVVSSARQAVKAEAAGADVLVAEGTEAAGINASQELTTLTLLPLVCRAVSIPAAAAGGVSDGASFAAVLSLGAQGAQLGTRLIATEEAQVHQHYKDALIQSGEQATIVVGRRYGRVRRLLDTPYARMLERLESEEENDARYMEKTDEESHIRGAVHGRLDAGHTNAGQAAAGITDHPPVRVVLENILHGAEAQLLQASRSLSSFSTEQL
ncbi:NAD(P)H-dependent flavin oxidoreductase [Alkalicoccus urumqiensis]|uniref:Probable nitronate monooxygenase n=1 Tax=Alkalicoccus urumqiensis TaxID=1548213 RepID=A0A2P6ME07_ALKUR|nr:nitronate monooxygenase [Alkalicoccus urumqiensis]PRO64496.1 2-nitropropane dioxygenase [Alkalicoccus urumqiensis]